MTAQDANINWNDPFGPDYVKVLEYFAITSINGSVEYRRQKDGTYLKNEIKFDFKKKLIISNSEYPRT